MDSNKSKNITESQIIKVGTGSVKGVIVNSHTSGTLKLVDGLYNGASATGTLTSTGASAPADYAQSVFTTTDIFSPNEEIVIGSITYKMVATPADAYDVAIGDTTAEALDNLKLAINGTGVAGTNYGVGTVAHPDVIATTNTDTAQTIRSRTIGDADATTAINAIATTTDCVNASWADTTLGGGTGDSNPAITTDNAKITIGDVVYTAVKTLAESLGLTAVPYQILWVTSEAVFLDNFKLAVNASGLAGTNYSTGTEAHPLVVATTNANDSQVIVAKKIGTGGNSIATTDTLGNYAWGGATLASGTGTDGKVIVNTITFPATAGITAFDRFINLGNSEFYTGLLAVVGGTADLTIVYHE